MKVIKSTKFLAELTMTTKKRLAILLEREEGQAALIELGYVRIEVLDEEYKRGYTQGLALGRKKVLQNAVEVFNFAESVQLDSGKLVKLLRHGYTVDGAQSAIKTMHFKDAQKNNFRFPPFSNLQ